MNITSAGEYFVYFLDECSKLKKIASHFNFLKVFEDCESCDEIMNSNNL